MWFRSNLGTIDTLIVADKGIHDEGIVFSGSTAPDSTRVGIGYYDFIIRESGGHITGTLHITRSRHGSDAKVFTLLKLRMGFTTLSEALDMSKETDDLGGWINIYGDYMLFDDRNSDYGEHEAIMRGKVLRYVILKDHGLEYYKFDDGEEFTRIPD